MATTAIILLIGAAYGRDLGANPHGIFCDEALIGLKARALTAGTMPGGTMQLFYNHFGTVAGALPIYATAPFVWLFGLNEFSLRLASAVFTLATGVVLWWTFRLLRLRSPWLPALIFILSPVVIHIGRINFGHAPSIFLLASGYALLLRATASHRMPTAIGAGVCLGLAAYGYPGFYVAVPLFISILAGSELIHAWRTREPISTTMVAILTAILCYSPILFEARTNPDFSKRFQMKDRVPGGLLSIDRLTNMIENYPKYYSLDVLFRKGESGLPNAFILRHSVTGAGLLPWIALPLIVMGILALVLTSWTANKRPFLPFLFLAVLFPLPDLLTTDWKTPPYTFTAYTGILCIPFLVAFGLKTIDSRRQAHASSASESLAIRLLHPTTITAILLVSSFFFVFSTYALYPKTSSGIWGWQSGPKDMVGYFVQHERQFSGLTIEGAFNDPSTLIDFYTINDDPSLRDRIAVGNAADLTTFDPACLYGVTAQTFRNRLNPNDWDIRNTVLYPDGSAAFYLVTHHTP